MVKTEKLYIAVMLKNNTSNINLPAGCNYDHTVFFFFLFIYFFYFLDKCIFWLIDSIWLNLAYFNEKKAIGRTCQDHWDQNFTNTLINKTQLFWPSPYTDHLNVALHNHHIYYKESIKQQCYLDSYLKGYLGMSL